MFSPKATIVKRNVILDNAFSNLLAGMYTMIMSHILKIYMFTFI